MNQRDLIEKILNATKTITKSRKSSADYLVTSSKINSIINRLLDKKNRRKNRMKKIKKIFHE